MAKKKDSIALFEVMQRKGDEGTPAVPEWAQKPAAQPGAVQAQPMLKPPTTPTTASPTAAKPFGGPTVPAAQATQVSVPAPTQVPPRPQASTPLLKPATTVAAAMATAAISGTKTTTAPAAPATSSAGAASPAGAGSATGSYSAAGSASTAGSTSSAPAPKAIEVPKPKPVAKLPPPAEPMITRTGDRMKVSLNYVSWAVVAAGVLLALAGSYYLGRSSAYNQQATVSPTPGAVAGPAGRETAAETFVPGKNYLVVATMAGNDPDGDAKSIIAFLGENNVKAAEVRLGSDNIVVCTRGFDSPSSAEADRFKQEIIKLGKKHRTGRAAEYDLAKPYYKKN